MCLLLQFLFVCVIIIVLEIFLVLACALLSFFLRYLFCDAWDALHFEVIRFQVTQRRRNARNLVPRHAVFTVPGRRAG